MKSRPEPFYFGIADRYDYATVEDPELRDPESAADDRMMDEREDIMIEFTYPLHRPVLRAFHKDGGFTRRDFAAAVSAGYEAIYDEEEKSRTTSPKPKGMLMNRSATDGVHGIWGHGIHDLVLEDAQKMPGGLWHIGVGS